MSEKPELKDGESFCFKCKNVVKNADFNVYYKICNECVDGSSGH